MQNTNHVDSVGYPKNTPIYIQGTRSDSQSESETAMLDRADSPNGQRNLSTLLAIRRLGFFCLFIAFVFTIRAYSQRAEFAQKMQEHKKAKDAAARTLYSQNNK